jgi:3'5'-cyclic nucleotide phosphodiesterase
VGVLRGTKGTFQVFGDVSSLERNDTIVYAIFIFTSLFMLCISQTVNTAARMESNSTAGRADSVLGKDSSTIDCCCQTTMGNAKERYGGCKKGKGKMVCYWCHPKIGADTSVVSRYTINSTSSSLRSTEVHDDCGLADMERHVSWMTEMFKTMLLKILNQNECVDYPENSTTIPVGLPRDEVSETIVLPKYVVETANSPKKNMKTNIDTVVAKELELYITTIALSYTNTNLFHNFAHACQVAMATQKLLSRVIQPNQTNNVSDSAYGMTSDPLTQLAIVFSALIHNVDHPGVSNDQLVKKSQQLLQCTIIGVLRNKIRLQLRGSY